MNFLTISVILCFAICIIFTVAIIVLSCFGYEIPETLIQYFFMTFGLELGATAAIKISKYAINKKELQNKIKLFKEYGFELTKEDVISMTKDSTDDFLEIDDEFFG